MYVFAHTNVSMATLCMIYVCIYANRVCVCDSCFVCQIVAKKMFFFVDYFLCAERGRHNHPPTGAFCTVFSQLAMCVCVCVPFSI